MSLIDFLTSSLGGTANKLTQGLSPYMMQQTSGADMRDSLLGHGVGGMMDEQKAYYRNLMQGNVPHAMRENIIGAGQDLAAGDAYNTSRLLSAGGFAPGSGLGAALGQVSSNQRGNEAIKNLASLSGDMMEMGQRGFDANLQDRAHINTSAFNLDQSNLRDTNQAMQQSGRGILNLVRRGLPMMGGPTAFLANKLGGGMIGSLMKNYRQFQTGGPGGGYNWGGG